MPESVKKLFSVCKWCKYCFSSLASSNIYFEIILIGCFLTRYLSNNWLLYSKNKLNFLLTTFILEWGKIFRIILKSWLYKYKSAVKTLGDKQISFNLSK